jgi:hypothetical protein
MIRTSMDAYARSLRLVNRLGMLPLALLAVLGCSLRGQSTRPDTSGDVISTLDDAKTLGSLRLVVRDSAALQQVWARAWSRHATIPGVPAIDFTRYDILVIAAGGAGITGGSIQLIRIESDKFGRTFHVRFHVPGPGCIGGTAMTYNAVFIRVPRAEKMSLWRDTLIAVRCEYEWSRRKSIQHPRR